MDKIPYPAAVDLSAYRLANGSPGLEAYYGLPRDIRFCRKCVISNQRPNSAVEYSHTRASRKETIYFDADGVCDACRLAEQKQVAIDWEAREVVLRDRCRHGGSMDRAYEGLEKSSIYRWM